MCRLHSVDIVPPVIVELSYCFYWDLGSFSESICFLLKSIVEEEDFMKNIYKKLQNIYGQYNRSLEVTIRQIVQRFQWSAPMEDQ